MLARVQLKFVTGFAVAPPAGCGWKENALRRSRDRPPHPPSMLSCEDTFSSGLHKELLPLSRHPVFSPDPPNYPFPKNPAPKTTVPDVPLSDRPFQFDSTSSTDLPCLSTRSLATCASTDIDVGLKTNRLESTNVSLPTPTSESSRTLRPQPHFRLQGIDVIESTGTRGHTTCLKVVR